MCSLQESATSSDKNKFICSVCHKIFKRSKDLKSHSVIHLDEKPYSCSNCLEAFKHKASLRRHLLIHSGEKPFACRVCGKSFRQKGSLNEHALTHTGEKPHACEVCNMGFTTKSNYIRHLRKHMTKKSFICRICDKGFNVRAYLVQHYKKIHEEISAVETDSELDLPVVDKVFYKLSNLDKFSVNKTAPDMLLVRKNTVEMKGLNDEGNLCKKQIKESKSLESQNLTSPGKNYNCQRCLKSFAEINDFHQHELIHSKNTISCLYCGNFFNKLESLQKHLKIHSEKTDLIHDIHSKDFIEKNRKYFDSEVIQKRYACFTCNKTYKKEIDFMQHSLIHKIPGPFCCDICADKTEFENLHKLHQHYSEHGDVSCVCFVCRDLSSNGFRDNDINIYSQTKLHKCIVCLMCFSDLNNLKNHSIFHAKRRPLVIKLKV